MQEGALLLAADQAPAKFLVIIGLLAELRIASTLRTKSHAISDHVWALKLRSSHDIVKHF